MQVAAIQGLQMRAGQFGQKRACELYVGNLAIGLVTGETLRELFTKLVTSIPSFNPALGPAVVNVQMHGEGKFAFVQFRDDELASTAMKFDKLMLCGRPINIGRPSGYVPPYPPVPPLDIPPEIFASVGLPVPPKAAFESFASLTAASGIGALGAPMGVLGAKLPIGGVAIDAKKQRELYCGNLAVGLVTPALLIELFTAPLATLPGQENKGPPVLNATVDKSGRFAFVEFRDEDLATMALEMFQNIELCGRPLQIGRPQGYVGPGGVMTGPPGVTIPGAMGQPPAAAPAAMPSTVIQLENLVSASELVDDNEYREIKEDIALECARSGKVVSLLIPRPGQRGVQPDDIGKAFVKFGTLEEAARAFRALDKRAFGGNTVKATFLPAMPAMPDS